jgi:hypothetical protein
VALFSTGCQTTRDLDPTGDYAGDRVLYEADALALKVFDSIDALTDFAARNPAVVAESDSFRELLDKIETNRAKWKDDFFKARDTYETVKTLANRDRLELSTQMLRAILSEIQTRQ